MEWCFAKRLTNGMTRTLTVNTADSMGYRNLDYFLKESGLNIYDQTGIAHFKLVSHISNRVIHSFKRGFSKEVFCGLVTVVFFLGHCELLALMKEDFKNVLLASVQAQWDQVRCALSAFTYFDALDEQSLREGCIVAKMKSYSTSDIILGDGVGVPNHVYFILDGKCQMIESLQVIVTTRLGREYYKLYDPYVPKANSEQAIYDKYFMGKSKASLEGRLPSTSNEGNNVEEAANRENNDSKVLIDKSTRKVSIVPGESRQKLISTEESTLFNINDENKSDKETLELKRENSEPETSGAVRTSSIDTKDTTKVPKNMEIKTYFMQVPQANSEQAIYQNNDSKVLIDKSTRRVSIVPGESRQKLVSIEDKTFESTLFNINDENKGDKETLELKRENSEPETSGSVRTSSMDTKDTTKVPKNMEIKTYFMQVCQYNVGATFGFGENMKDRRIIAMTPVDAMLIPKVWLLHKNSANIWTRLEHYLNRKIITKTKLFREFVNQRAWMDYKEMIVSDVVSRSKAVNHTSVHDVPYSIRLEEMIDIM